jgi:hypothetical protein
VSDRDAKVRAVLTAYGASADEVANGRLQRRQRQPVDWALVELLTAITQDKAEVAQAIGMSYSSIIRALRLWPEHQHLFAGVGP